MMAPDLECADDVVLSKDPSKLQVLSRLNDSAGMIGVFYISWSSNCCRTGLARS